MSAEICRGENSEEICEIRPSPKANQEASFKEPIPGPLKIIGLRHGAGEELTPKSELKNPENLISEFGLE